MAEDWVARLSPAVRAEAEKLCEEVLRGLEANDPPLTGLALKAARAARLVGHGMTGRLLELEASGYPTDGPMKRELYLLALTAGRRMLVRDSTPGAKGKVERVYTESIEGIEAVKRVAEHRLSKAITFLEQGQHTAVIQRTAGQLASRRATIHNYASSMVQALKFADVAADVFERTSRRVTELVAKHVPQGAEHLTSVYRNLESENPEDWANAVHSCRRLLKDVADKVFPPTEPITVQVDGKPKTIVLDDDHYVNRLISFVTTHAASERFASLVGSNLKFLGDRLGSIYSAANKGTHARVTKEEADRYVIHTYLMVGDILSLVDVQP